MFYPKAHDFLVDHNGTEIRKVTHYWANWDLANICAVYAIGVFCDRSDLVAEASNYYKSGRGCGASANNVYYLHPGYLGQWQESHRDQGHSTLGISLAGMLCQMAWNPGGRSLRLLEQPAAGRLGVCGQDEHGGCQR
ncbi:hypothetical protein [uncultured Variovorax sp.]|uniref:hypothetical protein n=1 Tax=uncultured Variovorax sp. TaxID=114708 RepID=UPI0025E83F70|nr:hypothetical protein [uncultured Variovorax sp.]